MRQRIDSVNDGQASTVLFDLFDKNSNPSTPTSVQYKITVYPAGTVVKNWSAASFVDEVVSIDVANEENTCTDPDFDEQREVTIYVLDGASEPFYDSAIYTVQHNPNRIT